MVLLLGSTGVLAADPSLAAYLYPLQDPYLATIIGTPTEYEPIPPEKIEYSLNSFKVFPDRAIPDVFWYQGEFRYSLSYQKGEAPLVFVIAGTGSSFYSSSMVFLQKILYHAGFHVICISSPTQMNFIVNASESCTPGYIVDDARDLYRVMTMAWEQVKDRIKVSEFYLMGYSLGASQSAFIAKLDEEKRVFNFKKVCMINPAVSLYSSAKRLDDMLLEIVPNRRSPEVFDRWLDSMLGKFGEAYRMLNHPDLDHDFLYDVYRKLYKTHPFRQENLAGMIGTVFRNLKSRNPGLSKESLIEASSLRSIASYLRNTPKIILMGNEDDLILRPADLVFLNDVFGSRAKFYPIGGHHGNMSYKDNVAYMINFFKN